MNLSETYSATNEANVGNSFQLTPSGFAIPFSQPSAITNAWPGGDGFNVAYLANDLKINHAVCCSLPSSFSSEQSAAGVEVVVYVHGRIVPTFPTENFHDMRVHITRELFALLGYRLSLFACKFDHCLTPG
jgi:hypothetical protein